jgi:uncharacterized GH25 family protein
MFYRKFLPAACALALVVLSVFGVRAASGGDIVGTVTDPMGAVVVGAQVTATDTATQKSSSATTDSKGRYQISNLPAGTYVVAVTAQGFVETKQEDVRVEDGKTVTADVQMRLPAV